MFYGLRAKKINDLFTESFYGCPNGGSPTG